MTHHVDVNECLKYESSEICRINSWGWCLNRVVSHTSLLSLCVTMQLRFGTEKILDKEHLKALTKFRELAEFSIDEISQARQRHVNTVHSIWQPLLINSERHIPPTSEISHKKVRFMQDAYAYHQELVMGTGTDTRHMSGVQNDMSDDQRFDRIIKTGQDLIIDLARERFKLSGKE